MIEAIGPALKLLITSPAKESGKLELENFRLGLAKVLFFRMDSDTKSCRLCRRSGYVKEGWKVSAVDSLSI